MNIYLLEFFFIWLLLIFLTLHKKYNDDGHLIKIMRIGNSSGDVSRPVNHPHKLRHAKNQISHIPVALQYQNDLIQVQMSLKGCKLSVIHRLLNNYHLFCKFRG